MSGPELKAGRARYGAQPGTRPVIPCFVGLVLLVGMVLTGCGDGGTDTKVATGAQVEPAGQGGPTMTLSLVADGTNFDSEPEPRGAVVIEDTSNRYAWVQAISQEDYALVQADGVPLGDGGVSMSLGFGVTQTAYADGDEYRLVSSDGSVDPEEVAPYLFDLASLPEGMTFTPVSVAATIATQFDAANDPHEILPEGVKLFTGTTGSEGFSVTTVAAELNGVVALLMLDRQQVEPGVWVGKVEPGRAVLLFEDPGRQRIVVVQGWEDQATILEARIAIVDQTAGGE